MDFTEIFKFVKTLITENDQEKLKSMIEAIGNTLMLAEREQFIGAKPYQHKVERNGHGNGFKPKQLKTSRFGSLELLHPQVRGSNIPFHSELFERYQRSEKALILAAAEMYFKGVSTRKIANLYGKIFETEISPQFVSNAAKQLDEQIQAWRASEIEQPIPYLILDAIYVKVRIDKRVETLGVLIAAGIQKDGKRRVLGFSVEDLESEETYKSLFQELKERGLTGVKYIVSDAHKGLVSAIKKSFHKVTWNRCKVHFIRNFAKKISNKKKKEKLYNYFKIAYAADNENEAQMHINHACDFLRKNKHPKLADRLEEEFVESIQFMNLPENHWRRMSTSNFIERLNGELKRRIYSIRIFPNVESAERLIGALLMEQDEEWFSSRPYANMDES